MSITNIDQTTASLICLVDIYSEFSKSDQVISSCSSKASQILMSGIENCPDEIKLSFCTLALATLTKVVSKKMLQNANTFGGGANVLEQSEIEFIQHVLNDYQ